MVMINPKLIELYGEGSRDMLTKLVDELGNSYASTCYVIVDDIMHIEGAIIPHSMVTTTTEKRWDIANKALSFIDKYTNPEEERAILIFDGEPSEGDIQLWLNSN